MVQNHGDQNYDDIDDDDGDEDEDDVNEDFLLSFGHLAPQKTEAVSNLANLSFCHHYKTIVMVVIFFNPHGQLTSSLSLTKALSPQCS